MPNRDKTGPFGKGPLTGRGFGDCNDQNDSKKPENDYREESSKPKKYSELEKEKKVEHK